MPSNKDLPGLSGRDKFKRVARTKEQEEAYDLVAARVIEKPTGSVASVLALIKSALGAGILSGHVAYMYAGYLLAMVTHISLGLVQLYNLYRLVLAGNTLCARTHIPAMTYQDVGECAMTLSEKPFFMKMSRFTRIMIEISIYCDLGGACICYQLIIAQGIKQLVEDAPTTSLDPLIPGYPGVRMYMVILLIPFLAIAMIRHIAWLAPLAMGANLIIALSIGATIYYAAQENPNFENLIPAKDFSGFFKFVGIGVFSMSCGGMIFSLENNMKNPRKFPLVLIIGMLAIIASTVAGSFFGYVAYLENSVAPITLNFPMDTLPKILKIGMVIMVYVTLGLNFYVPFNILFYYIKPKLDQNKLLTYEYVFRAGLLIVMNCMGIVYPDISGVLSLAGCFGIAQISFIWPPVIDLLVRWERPGLGVYNWRVWKCLVLLSIGLFIFTAGTYVNLVSLLQSFGII